MTSKATRVKIRQLLRNGVPIECVKEHLGVSTFVVRGEGSRMQDPGTQRQRYAAQTSAVRRFDDEYSRCAVCGGMVVLPCKSCEMKERGQEVEVFFGGIDPIGMELAPEDAVRLEAIQLARIEAGDIKEPVHRSVVEAMKDW